MIIKPGKILIYADKKTEDLMVGYLERIERDVACLKCALNNHHFEAIRLLGHRMNFSGDCYGFAGISEIGEALEEASRSRDFTLANELLDTLLSYIDDIVIEYA